MAKRNAPVDLRALVEQLTGQLTELVAAEVERRVAETLGSLRAEAKVSSRPVRLCPVPGCGKPGAGPRNRYFCSAHAKDISKEEQRSILERTKRLQAEGKLPQDLSRVVRLPPRGPRSHRPLDMSCRVEGCGNRSRGPRAGFICDTHRAQLTPEEQAEARARWNQRKKAEAGPAVSAAAVTPVPPIVRKPDPAAAS